jgi:hypothetical protein
VKITDRLVKKIALAIPLLAVIVFAVMVAQTHPVGAQPDPTETKMLSLTKKLQDAIVDAAKNGQFTTDKHGQSVYAGETAKKMEALHKEVADEMRELQARPMAEREKTIDAINKWNDQFLYTVSGQPKQSLQYGGKLGGVQNIKRDGMELYYSEDYAFEIDSNSNKLVDVYIRPKEQGEPKEWLDMTARFNADQLEQKARSFVGTQNLGVDLSALKLERDQKIGTFFYTWTGTDGKSLQVAYTQGGQLIGYTNVGFFENL